MSEPVDKQFGAARAKRLERGRLATWKPIETAPKDGRWVLVYGGTSIHDPQDGSEPPFECKCNTIIQAFMNLSGKWESAAENWTYLPTHWMPLPTPPEGVK